MSKLSNLINDALDRTGRGGMSSRELSGLVNGAIGKDTITRYRRGDHAIPSEGVLEALSVLTSVDMDTLRRAAGSAGKGEWTPPGESVRLTLRQRQALDELIRAIVATEDRSDEPEWLLAHPERDQILQRQLADVRGVRAINDSQRDELEATIRSQRRAALINELRDEDKAT